MIALNPNYYTWMSFILVIIYNALMYSILGSTGSNRLSRFSCVTAFHNPHLLTHIFPNLSQTMIICAFTDPQACTPFIHRYPLLLPLLYLSLSLGQLHLSLYRYDCLTWFIHLSFSSVCFGLQRTSIVLRYSSLKFVVLHCTTFRKILEGAGGFWGYQKTVGEATIKLVR